MVSGLFYVLQNLTDVIYSLQMMLGDCEFGEDIGF